MDRMTPEERRRTMKAIKGKDTRPERMVRSYLFSKGLRYRKNVKNLPGTPDIVLRKWKTVVFVNGCFWHGHQGCTLFSLPSTNKEFWLEKIERNINRDQASIQALEKDGWRVITVWECELRRKETREEALSDLYLEIVTKA